MIIRIMAIISDGVTLVFGIPERYGRTHAKCPITQPIKYTNGTLPVLYFMYVVIEPIIRSTGERGESMWMSRRYKMTSMVTR